MSNWKFGEIVSFGLGVIIVVVIALEVMHVYVGWPERTLGSAIAARMGRSQPSYTYPAGRIIPPGAIPTGRRCQRGTIYRCHDGSGRTCICL